MSPTRTEPPMGTGPTGAGGAESAAAAGAGEVEVEAAGAAEAEGAVEVESAGAGAGGGAGAAAAHEAVNSRSSERRIGHRPWKRGLRFSAKAASASRRSSLTMVLS